MTGTSIFALLLAAAAALAGGNAASSRAITGHVLYRDRYALPPDAVVRVRLEVEAAPERSARRVAEVLVRTEGRQVPIAFTLPYEESSIDPAKRYVVRATISSGSTMLYASRSRYPVLTHGAPATAEILVEPSGKAKRPRVTPSSTDLGLGGAEWRLVSLGDPPDAASAPTEATLVFEGGTKRISGSTGCNRFFGAYAPGDGASLRLDPSGMTMMACPEDVARREQAFLAALRATTAYRISAATLELLDGDRVVARFEAAAGSAAPSD